MGAEGGKDGIGFYTAVLGQSSVTHPGEDRVLPVKLHDEVLLQRCHSDSRRIAHKSVISR